MVRGVRPRVDTGKAAWREWAKGRPSEFDNDAVVGGLRAFLLGRERVGVVLTYRPMLGEIDLDRLLEEFECAVTRTWPGGRLTVHGADVEYERHRWGYLQPVADAPTISLDSIRAVLVPGVLFDRYGGRLGHGAGYYDRLLPQLGADTLRIGIAGGHRVVEEVPTDAHDVRMTHLATEHGVAVVMS
jgi:5-formyltetrahydrofolate cyclo-ligase